MQNRNSELWYEIANIIFFVCILAMLLFLPKWANEREIESREIPVEVYKGGIQ